MCDGKPLRENPAKDPVTGMPKDRPGMVQAGATVPILRIFGVTEAGNSVMTHVHGFTPYFICDAPAGFNEHQHTENFRRALDQAVREQSRGRQDKNAHFVLDVEPMRKRSLVGFSPGNQSALFLKVYMGMPNMVPTARRVLERGFAFSGSRHEYLTYESNIPFVLRFMVDKDITGCCWVELPKGTYSLRGDGLAGPPGTTSSRGLRKTSRMQIEADICHTELVAHESVGRWMKIAPIRILSFDIECQGRKGHFPEAEKDPVIQIASVVTVQGESAPRIKAIHVLDTCTDIVGATVYTHEDERDLLRNWARFLVQSDFDVITGYNIQNFDLPYVFNRAKALGVHSQVVDISRVVGRRATMREATFSSSAYGTRKDWETTICGRLVFDMIKYMRRNHKFSSYTLNAVSAHFLGQQKEDVHYSIISDLQNGTADDRRRLAVYCIKDALLPQRLMDKLYVLINYIEMARVTGVPLDYLNSRGQQIKVMSMLLRKCKLKGDLVIPTPKRQQGGTDGVAFEGATVIEPKKGFYKDPIATLDFASLYPSIMQAHNLCYSTLLTHSQATQMPESSYSKTPNGHYFVNQTVRQGILPEILGELLSARKRAKKDMKAAKDPLTKNVMNGRQLALKISANSVYGFTGATVGQLPCLQISSSVTAYGREMIDATKAKVESTYTVANGYPADATVIYGDTDSVMIKFGVPDVATAIEMGAKAAPEITQALFKPPIKLEFEKVYKPYLLMNKKRYAGLYWTRPEKFDKLDTKGIETVRRDNCGLVRTVIAHCLNRILIHSDVNGAIAYVKRQISDLLQNKVDISMLVISKAMSKSPDSEDYVAKQAHVELARRLAVRDKATAPVVGDRVPYVITKAGGPRAAAYEKSEDPLYALENNVPLDTAYYLHNQLSKPLLRIFGPIIGENAESVLLRGAHTRHIVKATPTAKKGGIMGFAVRKKTRCIGCKSLVELGADGKEQALCRHCKSNEGLIYAKRQVRRVPVHAVISPETMSSTHHRFRPLPFFLLSPRSATHTHHHPPPPPHQTKPHRSRPGRPNNNSTSSGRSASAARDRCTATCCARTETAPFSTPASRRGRMWPPPPRRCRGFRLTGDA